MKKKNVKDIVIRVLIILFAAVLVFSAVNVVLILLERKEAADTYEDLRNFLSVATKPPKGDKYPQGVTQTGSEGETHVPTETSPEGSEGAGTEAEKDPPEPEKDTSPVQVDFDALCTRFPDVVGWIYSEDTLINYPVVRGYDNNQYLRHLLTGEYNVAGSIFADFRTTTPGEDDFYVIYGHQMDDHTMFGSLRSYDTQEYYDDHSVIYYLTPEKDYRLEIVAGTIITATDDIYKITFPSSDALYERVSELSASSSFKPKFDFDRDDKYVVLSTCTYEFWNARFVVIGKVVELER